MGNSSLVKLQRITQQLQDEPNRKPRAGGFGHAGDGMADFHYRRKIQEGGTEAAILDATNTHPRRRGTARTRVLSFPCHRDLPSSQEALAHSFLLSETFIFSSPPDMAWSPSKAFQEHARLAAFPFFSTL